MTATSSPSPTTPAADTDEQVLDVRIRFTPTLPVVRLSGELDLSSVHLLADALGSIAAANCPAPLVVLDLTDITFCDITGLQGIEDGGRMMTAAGKELLLYHPPQRVTKLIEMTGIARSLSRR
jgi:anti-anti-sigma factor